jgi:hypothetical protein
MVPTIKEAQKLLIIDKNNLDNELVGQAEIYATIGLKVAEAVSERDHLKEQVEIIFADIAREFRESAEKVTEGKVQEHVQLHPKYNAVKKDYLDAKKAAEEWMAIRDAFGQRVSMLKELCGLYSSEYWTRDSVKTKAEKEVEYSGLRRRIKSSRTGG